MGVSGMTVMTYGDDSPGLCSWEGQKEGTQRQYLLDKHFCSDHHPPLPTPSGKGVHS